MPAYAAITAHRVLSAATLRPRRQQIDLRLNHVLINDNVGYCFPIGSNIANAGPVHSNVLV